VTLWGERASEDAAVFISYLAHHPLLVVGLHHYTVQSVSLSRHPWVSLATWTDLMSPSNDHMLGLRFVTPTMFQEPSVDARPGLDFPEPAVVFSQLLQRWVSLGGPPLTSHLSSFLEGNGCIASDYRLHICHHLLPHGMYTGWVGWVLYACHDQHPESIAAINGLARLACFTGTGFATEHGMGLTRLMHPQERR